MSQWADYVDYMADRADEQLEREREPDDNRPDAVCDDDLVALVRNDIVPWIVKVFGRDGAVLLAHQILSEVEASTASPSDGGGS